MNKNAFIMKLKPGFASVYRQRHDEIWPELSQRLKAAGISDYSIFLDAGTNTLFAVQWSARPDQAAALPQDPVVRKWWDFMSDIMETNPDKSPVCIPLEQVFHLE
jgi:L-rhamnose mutarotase